MKKIITVLTMALALAAASTAQAEDPVYDGVYDWCPNLDWAYSPYDAWQQTGDLYEMKFSKRDGTYICVRAH